MIDYILKHKTVKNFCLIHIVALSVMLLFGCAAGESETGASTTVNNENSGDNTVATDSSTIIIGYAIRNLDNPYYAQAVDGVKNFIAAFPAGTFKLEVMLSGGDSQKQISDIAALINRGREKTILIVDPNETANVDIIARLCEQERVYWSTIWTTSPTAQPADFKRYVFHQTGADRQFGYDIAVALFSDFSLPGSGNIVAVHGDLANSAAAARAAGLTQAVSDNQGINLLAQQDCGWIPEQAAAAVENWLSLYGRQIDGIWVANDNMAMAVIDVLQKNGLNGEIKVVSIDGAPAALQALRSGDMSATVSPVPWAQAGFAASINYMAYQDKLDRVRLPITEKFLTKGILITADNVNDFFADYIDVTPDMDYNDFKNFIFMTLFD